MLNFQTPVLVPRSSTPISLGNHLMLLGSCFADDVGRKFKEAGFDVCINPFGTLYNPASISSAIARLADARSFVEEDCVAMGAGSGLICSFHHHTSFARPTVKEFLDNANAALYEAHQRWEKSDRVLLTLGTAWCFRHLPEGEIVSNCLKRPSSEFERVRMSIDEVEAELLSIVRNFPEKRFFLTVSPVRHLADGANGNQLSKSTLLLAIDRLAARGEVDYFPSYEIMMDELRDYRFYAEDMVHPSPVAVKHIWERFCEFALPRDEMQRVIDNEKAFKRSQHRQMH